MGIVLSVFQAVFVIWMTVCAAFHYGTGDIARACFFLLAAGIVLILNEVKRNARIVNHYEHCDFITPVTPQPGPASPGSQESGDEGTTAR